ncbi:restriction endonuclease subunit S [Stenotrophomonas acidaminiphila]|uniref:restriction endonuclease subunit S n=1 Tax=Stenotrophomonas acidaminiphila TaxID=128780 RepID=UPI002ABDE778|nr:restriction endonuclease subunit S [Stenotrophomonas acidaminiphila]WPU55049.1 restriction endonuclease subunit S [Stenotrophomonas acidaminiphila]
MKLPRYPEYKNSGIEWLGNVPASWRVERFKVSVKSCRNGVWGGEPNGDSDDIECVRVADFDRARFVVNQGVPTLRSITEREREGRILEAGNLLLEKSGGGEVHPVGQVVLYEREVPAICSNFIARIELSAGMVPRYWMYQHAAAYSRGVNVGSIKQTSGIQNLDQNQYLNEQGVYPTEYEQAAIAVFLDRETAKIDALIAEQEKLIALLAEKRQATIFHAVTKGLNPSAPMKDSGVPWLGEVPAHWEIVPLKYVAELRSGGTPSKDNLDYWGGDIPWASAKDLKVERLGDTADHITQAAVESGGASLVRQGAILVVVRGMILARMFPVVETLVPMAINQDLKAVLPSARLSASFLAWLLRGSAGESLQRLDEAGHGTKALRMDAWTSIHLPIPPLEEQALVAEFVVKATTRLDELRTSAVRAIDLLTERRSALIAAAVTGQIDVRGEVAEVAA